MSKEVSPILSNQRNYQIISEFYDEKFFGNGQLKFSFGELTFLITKDRGDLFADVSIFPSGKTKKLETIASNINIRLLRGGLIGNASDIANFIQREYEEILRQLR